ncbi:MAG: hypothetical protein AAF471_08770 [Myxococcota bacterium]
MQFVRPFAVRGWGLATPPASVMPAQAGIPAYVMPAKAGIQGLQAQNPDALDSCLRRDAGKESTTGQQQEGHTKPMKKHKARRKQRQAGEATRTGTFNPRNHNQCTSSSCRRARKCLGRAMICGCTVEYASVADESSVEKLRQLRWAIDTVMAINERREAAGIPHPTPQNPIFSDPNATEEEIDQAIVADLKARMAKMT